MQSKAQAVQNINVSNEIQSIGFQPRYLVSKYVDWFLIGGASIMALVITNILVPKIGASAQIALIMFNLAFLVNFPHFLISYFMLYDDYRNKIFTELRFFWAAVIVPILILVWIVLAFIYPQSGMLSHLTNSLFFFVGWHYVKQIFGGVIVSNALIGYYYDSLTRVVLKWNLFSLWAISFLAYQTKDKSRYYYGISYHTYNLPKWTLKLAYYSLAITGIMIVVLHVSKYLRDKKTPCLAAIVCFFSIYAWYIPALVNPTYLYMIPFFHSLQYLLFAYVFRKNKIEATHAQKNKPASGLYKWGEMLGYFIMAILFGGVLMHYLPTLIDREGYLDNQLYGLSPFYFSFLIFINIHHYFIDNILWRGDNDQMQKYLLKPHLS